MKILDQTEIVEDVVKLRVKGYVVWKTMEEDIITIAAKMRKGVSRTRAIEILSLLDNEAIQEEADKKAACDGPAKRAYAEIKRQIISKGLLNGTKRKESL